MIVNDHIPCIFSISSNVGKNHRLHISIVHGLNIAPLSLFMEIILVNSDHRRLVDFIRDELLHHNYIATREELLRVRRCVCNGNIKTWDGTCATPLLNLPVSTVFAMCGKTAKTLTFAVTKDPPLYHTSNQYRILYAASKCPEKLDKYSSFAHDMFVTKANDRSSFFVHGVRNL